MLKRPSSRRNSNHSEVNVNLVPMLDALVTMISFLMYTMAFLALTMVDTTVPTQANMEDLEKKKTPPLQLTLTVGDQGLELLSDTSRFPKITIPNLNDAQGNATLPDYEKLHQEVVELKKKFPEENKIFIQPNGETTYEVIFALIDRVKNVDQNETVILKKQDNPVDEIAKTLFGDISFTNIQGD